MKFIFIDERDRDAIINHIAKIQLKRIRQLREHFALREGIDNPADMHANVRTRWFAYTKNFIYMAVLFAFLVMLYVYFKGYSTNHPKSEIENTFENGIRKYIQKWSQ